MCKITCFSDFRRPVVLVVGPALGAELECGGGVWDTGSKGPPPPELHWAAVVSTPQRRATVILCGWLYPSSWMHRARSTLNLRGQDGAGGLTAAVHHRWVTLSDPGPLALYYTPHVGCDAPSRPWVGLYVRPAGAGRRADAVGQCAARKWVKWRSGHSLRDGEGQRGFRGSVTKWHSPHCTWGGRQGPVAVPPEYTHLGGHEGQFHHTPHTYTPCTLHSWA